MTMTAALQSFHKTDRCCAFFDAPGCDSSSGNVFALFDAPGCDSGSGNVFALFDVPGCDFGSSGTEVG